MKKIPLLFLLVCTLFIFSGCDEYSTGIAKLGENEVGVILNNLTGEMEVEPTPGTKLFFPVIKSFYTLDKKEQTLEMTSDPSSGSRFSKDDVKIRIVWRYGNSLFNTFFCF